MPDPAKIIKQARQIARDESLELIKTAAKQVRGEKAQASEPTAGEEKPAGEAHQEEKIKQQDLRRIEALETEMQAITKRREEEYQQRAAQQFEPEESQETLGAPKPLVEPPTKPKRGSLLGPRARVERAKRTTELGKTPSG